MKKQKVDQDEMTISLMNSRTLSKVAKGEIDLNDLAREELACRGEDSNGFWVGFKNAKKHFNIED